MAEQGCGQRPEREAVYAAAQLGQLAGAARRTGGVVVTLALALALALGLATPALASSGQRPVHTGAVRTSHAAHLAAGAPAGRHRQPGGRGSISGHVTFPAGYGNRAQHAVVRNGHFTREVPVSRYGDYWVGRLPAGSYRVTFDRVSGFSLYEAQFWSGHPESAGVASADRVTVGPTDHVTDIDATLRVGGSITGTLVDGHHRPLDNCLVQAYTTGDQLVTRSGLSGGDGSFAITGLTTGAYLVRVTRHGTESDCDGPRQFLVSTTGGALAPSAEGVAVPARAGQATQVGTQVYATAGKITGQVTLPSGSISRDQNVVARSLVHPGYAVRARIHPDGGYVLRGLSTGSYRVTFDRLSGQAVDEAAFYRGHPESAGPESRDAVQVTRGETTTLRATTLRPGGTLTGTLVDPTGAPLGHCQVQAFTTDNRLVTRTAFTGPDGTFSIGGLTTGSYLVRALHGQRRAACNAHSREFYDGSAALSPGDPRHPPRSVRVRVGRATALGRLTYRVAATISGTVTFPGPRPYYEDQYVVARRGSHAVRASVARDGSYQIRGLAPGSYRVTFDRISGFSLYAAQFYDGHAEPETRASADRVVVGAGEQRTGIDATLQAGRHLTGRVVDADGRGLYCEVQAFTADGHLVTRDAYVGYRDGTFDIGGLSAGKYYVRVIGQQNGRCTAGSQYLGGSGRLTATGPGRQVDTRRSVSTSLGTLQYASSLRAVVMPSTSGTPRVGSVLTAAPGQWSPSDGLTYAYQWLSAGQAVPGATGSTYSPSATDVGHQLAVRVTASKPGYVSGSARSAPTTAVQPGSFALKKPPQVTGTPAIGQVLSMRPAKISPAPSTTTYQWLRNGTPIKKATAATYRLVKADQGRQVSVQVTYLRPGYLDLVVTTASVPVT